MRKLFIATSIFAALAAGSAMAQEVEQVTIDLNTFCAGGCTVAISFTDKARYADTAIMGGGEFTSDAKENPLEFMTGLAKTDDGVTVFVLSSEPGSPRFHTVEQVQAYMAGLNDRMQHASYLQRQEKGS